MTCTEPAAFAIRMAPFVPILTVTRLGIVWPGKRFRFETPGWLTPDGHTETKLCAVPPVTVTFATTAVAVAGTPRPLPGFRTTRSRGDPEGNGPAQPPVVVRESSRRTGVIPVNRSPATVPSS